MKLSEVLDLYNLHDSPENLNNFDKMQEIANFHVRFVNVYNTAALALFHDDSDVKFPVKIEYGNDELLVLSKSFFQNRRDFNKSHYDLVIQGKRLTCVQLIGELKEANEVNDWPSVEVKEWPVLKLPEGLNLFNLHSDPKTLDKHDQLSKISTYEISGIDPHNEFIEYYIFSTSKKPPFEFKIENINVTILKRDEKFTADKQGEHYVEQRIVWITGTKIDCNLFIGEVQEQNWEHSEYNRPLVVKEVG